MQYLFFCLIWKCYFSAKEEVASLYCCLGLYEEALKCVDTAEEYLSEGLALAAEDGTSMLGSSLQWCIICENWFDFAIFSVRSSCFHKMQFLKYYSWCSTFKRFLTMVTSALFFRADGVGACPIKELLWVAYNDPKHSILISRSHQNATRQE